MCTSCFTVNWLSKSFSFYEELKWISSRLHWIFLFASLRYLLGTCIRLCDSGGWRQGLQQLGSCFVPSGRLNQSVVPAGTLKGGCGLGSASLSPDLMATHYLCLSTEGHSFFWDVLPLSGFQEGLLPLVFRTGK